MTMLEMSSKHLEKRRIPGRQAAGMTLIEVLAASTLLAVLVTSVYLSMQIANLAHRTATRRIGPVRAAELGVDAMRQDLVAAMAPTGVLAGDFEGEAERLSFHAAREPASTDPASFEVEPEASAADLSRIEYELTEAGGDLVRRITRNLLAESPKAVTQVLVRGVQSVTFRYFDGIGYLDEWSSTDGAESLPFAVEVKLTLAVPAEATSSVASLAAQQSAGDSEMGYTARRLVLLPCRDPSQQEDLLVP